MAIVTIPDLRRRYGREIDQAVGFEKVASPLARSMAGKRILLNEARIEKADKQYDVFLSHSYADGETVLLLKRFLEGYRQRVYVDWIEDPELSRMNVCASTASKLRERIEQCPCLLVATSPNADHSTWIPWELGYADGKDKRVGILPYIEKDVSRNEYHGNEYLALYPYVSEEEGSDGNRYLWATKEETVYVEFAAWLQGREPFEHPIRAATPKPTAGRIIPR